MNGTIVKAWKDASNAYLAVAVAEGGGAGNVEYLGSTPLLDSAGAAKPLATLKAECVADVAAKRAAQVAAAQALAVSGTVTV